MNSKSMAPCGLNCDLCSAFQREKNHCVGCNRSGEKPLYCITCKIKNCPEKGGKDQQLCSRCAKFPCRRIKNMEKRYTKRYGVSLIGNLTEIGRIGIKAFSESEKQKWKCSNCGHLLCVHKERCLVCGAINDKYPRTKSDQS
jgi:hypothetical protein